ncbi:four helix bundle protein [Arenimonas composti]|uniref:Four helix bundle protein n=1 Tax=Arenimonas composti TR7-09 = DSM 18010 TaxID=1121013 RepID=A0A091BAF8_9GAMM|nr:four helix bundle protein [Arenimonas composti]KFN48731.1 hypothetical protein P873_13825 [Arenimonas composti TR7-09 = DSM 18010]
MERSLVYAKSVVWAKSMRLAQLVLLLSRRLPRDERFGIRSQLTRAATSVPSNIAEGWVRESRREKVQFLAIAHGSLAELHTQLLLCCRIQWLDPQETEPAFALADEIGRMLTALRRKWSTSEKAGTEPDPPPPSTRLPASTDE